jgi:DNA polymerase-4
MDAFFAAIEVQRHPEYKNKPLIVGGSGNPKSRGVVSTCSYEARKFGINSGMPLRVAYRKCPQAIFLPVDFRKYAQVSQKLMNILKSYTDLVEAWGLDEAFLDVSHIKKEPKEVAWEIKKRVESELGLTTSVGVASNKLLAKIASGLKKPDNFCVIEDKNIAKILSPLSVSKLLGVGKRTEARLRDKNIETIRDLAEISLDELKESFGKSLGSMLYNFSRGIDESPVVAHYEPKSFGRETTFQQDTDDLGMIKETLAQFAQYLTRELKTRRYRGKTVIVKIRYRGFITHTHAHTMSKFVDSYKRIYSEAVKLLAKFDFERKVRLVGLRISNLEKVAQK